VLGLATADLASTRRTWDSAPRDLRAAFATAECGQAFSEFHQHLFESLGSRRDLLEGLASAAGDSANAYEDTEVIMIMAITSLRDYTGARLGALCRAVGFPGSNDEPIRLLHELLGPMGARPLLEPPQWESDVADDKTPIEFSVAFDENGSPTIRILVEPVAAQPSHRANMELSKQLLHSLSDRFGFSLDQFHAVSDLFLPEEPQGKFAFWYSLVLRPNGPPAFKLYFNPEIRGHCRAPRLVQEGFDRLGFRDAYDTVVKHGGRREHHLDRFSFFSIDLHQRVHPRVKVYLSHHAAEAASVEWAAQATDGVKPGQVEQFCRLAGGGTGPFTRRPLISSFAFVEGDTDRPSGYTVYLPVRDYVTDDEAARARAIALMRQHDLDPAVLDRALNAVARRSLAEGVGLIPHLSLRLGRSRPGITIYLSVEAYEVAPPRASALAS